MHYIIEKECCMTECVQMHHFLPHTFCRNMLKAHTVTLQFYSRIYGFGGLGVACWPLVPKLAGSNVAKAVGFLG